MEQNTPLQNRPLLGSTSRSASTTPGVQGSFIDYRLKVKGMAGAMNAANARPGAGRTSGSNMPTILADKLAQKRTETASQSLEGSGQSPTASPTFNRLPSTSAPPPRQMIQHSNTQPISFDASKTFAPSQRDGVAVSNDDDDDQVLAGSESSSMDSEPRSRTPTPSPVPISAVPAQASVSSVVTPSPPRSDSAQLDALMEMINNAGTPSTDPQPSSSSSVSFSVAAPVVAPPESQPQPVPKPRVRPITMGDFMDDPRLDVVMTRDEDFISALEMSDTERAEFLETLIAQRPKKQAPQSPSTAPTNEIETSEESIPEENVPVTPRMRPAPPSQPLLSLPDSLRSVASSPANVSSSSLKTVIEEVTEEMMDSLTDIKIAQTNGPDVISKLSKFKLLNNIQIKNCSILEDDARLLGSALRDLAGLQSLTVKNCIRSGTFPSSPYHRNSGTNFVLSSSTGIERADDGAASQFLPSSSWPPSQRYHGRKCHDSSGSSFF
jgi:hypothetical protein